MYFTFLVKKLSTLDGPIVWIYCNFSQSRFVKIRGFTVLFFPNSSTIKVRERNTQTRNYEKIKTKQLNDRPEENTRRPVPRYQVVMNNQVNGNCQRWRCDTVVQFDVADTRPFFELREF